MNELISVIVPVYKVEAYLDRCVQSLVKQTYDNIEIILVDDGSPDNCPKLCDVWSTQDKRIKVIHKENGGQSEARNVGISQAYGQYITFVDSDDYVDENFVECLYSQILETGAQVSCVGIKEFHDELEVAQDKNHYEVEVYNNKTAIAALFDPTKYQDYVWNKMFERQLFNEISFPCGHIFEDLAIVYKIFEQCKTISYCPARLYYYFQRSGSSMHNSSLKWLADWYQFSKERYIYVNDKYPEMCENYKYFNSVILQSYPILNAREKEFAEKEFKKNRRYVADGRQRSVPKHLWLKHDCSFEMKSEANKELQKGRFEKLKPNERLRPEAPDVRGCTVCIRRHRKSEARPTEEKARL